MQPRWMKNSLQRCVIKGLGDIVEVSYTGRSTGVLTSGAGGDPTDGCWLGEDSSATCRQMGAVTEDGISVTYGQMWCGLFRATSPALSPPSA